MLFDAVGFGVGSAAPRLRIEPQLSLIYDSNIARSSKAAAEARGLTRSDFVSTPGLKLDASLPVGNQSLFLDSDIAYDFYAHNKKLNGARLRIASGARLRLSRCLGTVSLAYARRRSELEDLLDLDPVKNIESVRTFAIDGRCGGPVGLVPVFGVSRSRSDNSQPLREFSNSVSTSGKAGLAYVRPSFGELLLLGEVRRVRYPNRSQFSALTDGYRERSIGARFERAIGARLQTKLGLFRTSVDADRGNGRFTGMTANLDAIYRVNDRLKTELTMSRDVRPANFGGGDFVVASRLAAEGVYGLSPRLSFRAGTAVERRRTEGPSILAVTQLISERRYSGFGRLTYTYSDRAALDAELRREVRNADPSLFDYSSTRAMINLRYIL